MVGITEYVDDRRTWFPSRISFFFFYFTYLHLFPALTIMTMSIFTFLGMHDICTIYDLRDDVWNGFGGTQGSIDWSFVSSLSTFFRLLSLVSSIWLHWSLPLLLFKCMSWSCMVSGFLFVFPGYLIDLCLSRFDVERKCHKFIQI